MSLAGQKGDDVSIGLSELSKRTRKQLLPRLDLCVRLDANDYLPTRPSAVLPNLVGASLTGAVLSAKCPQ
jgi:hypothetical protein